MCTGGHIVSEYTGYTITRLKLIMQVLDQKDFKGFFKSARYDVQKSFDFL